MQGEGGAGVPRGRTGRGGDAGGRDAGGGATRGRGGRGVEGRTGQGKGCRGKGGAPAGTNMVQSFIDLPHTQMVLTLLPSISCVCSPSNEIADPTILQLIANVNAVSGLG